MIKLPEVKYVLKCSNAFFVQCTFWMQEPQLLSVPINGFQRQTWSRICWLQKFHGGLNNDVWAIDGVQVLPHFPQRLEVNKNKVAQFSINLQCGNDPVENRYVYWINNRELKLTVNFWIFGWLEIIWTLPSKMMSPMVIIFSIRLSLSPSTLSCKSTTRAL